MCDGDGLDNACIRTWQGRVNCLDWSEEDEEEFPRNVSLRLYAYACAAAHSKLKTDVGWTGKPPHDVHVFNVNDRKGIATDCDRIARHSATCASTGSTKAPKSLQKKCTATPPVWLTYSALLYASQSRLV